MSKIVLHISSDFPGPYSPSHVTVAIRDSMKSLEPEFTNYLIVPRRRRSYGRTEITTLGRESHVSVFDPIPFYFGGVNRLNWGEISGKLLGDSKPSLVHSHKLSYEAYIGDALARHWRVPHLISIRGSSDTHWRNHLPLTSSRYRSLLESSTQNLWLSMWAQAKISDRTGYLITQKDLSFPTGVPECEIVNLQRVINPISKRFVCVARLDDFKQKGILDLIFGFKSASEKDKEISLDIIGPSTPKTKKRLLEEIERVGMIERIRLKDPMSRSDIIQALTQYSAFVLLSINETFGLVFVEALLAGIPIIYLKDSGVDGYDFADKYGVRCESRLTEDVSAAILDMSGKAGMLRNDLHTAIGAGLIEDLGAAGMSRRYRAIIESALMLKS